jgi:cobalt-precorrin 5A hydrolase
MRLAVISFTNAGKELGEKLARVMDGDHEVELFHKGMWEGSLDRLVARLWEEFDGIIFISAAGIASRLIAPHLRNKLVDPAVICMDDTGRFAIPILSGHYGGANEMARQIAASTGASPVITTATDNRGIQAPDMFAKDNGYVVENPESLARITSMMVNGEPVGFYGEFGPSIEYSELVHLNGEDLKNCMLPGVIAVSNRLGIEIPGIPNLVLRPPNINLGLGCRKEVSGGRIIDFIYEVLSEEGLSPLSVGNIGTIELKRNEPGIIEAAEHFGCGLKIFSGEDISKVQDMFMKSDFVKNTVGVNSVSAPAAYLMGGNLIREKAIKNGITLSVTVEV